MLAIQSELAVCFQDEWKSCTQNPALNAFFFWFQKNSVTTHARTPTGASCRVSEPLT